MGCNNHLGHTESEDSRLALYGFPHICFKSVFLRNSAFSQLRAAVQCSVCSRTVSFFHQYRLHSD